MLVIQVLPVPSQVSRRDSLSFDLLNQLEAHQSLTRVSKPFLGTGTFMSLKLNSV
jgi:hypothetical protein